MEKSIGKEYANVIQRKTFLKDNCDEVVEKSYYKQFTNQQMQDFKEDLADTEIQLNGIEREFEVVKSDFKGRMKPLKERKDKIVENIRMKSEFVREQCYKFIDQESKQVGFYNEDGDLIEERPAMADELQATIFTAIRRDNETKEVANFE
ncbi:MAG: hypothetical protein J6P44_02200 [Bacteroidales bacterium]|nr:hypothetical protein [Bacteroidales bacterium]